jgi:hypothetical protein
MDNERPGEYRSWRHRLEEPGALPGVGLTDKEAAWDKLYHRLGGTPRRRTLPWLWTAAACLLLALVPAAFFLREKRVMIYSNPSKVTGQRKTNQPRTPAPDPGPSIIKQNTLPPLPSQPITTLHPGRRENLAYAKRPAPAKAPAIARIPTLTHTPIILQSPARQPLLLLPPRPDLSRPIAASIPAAPKKALRVVHINELEPQQPTPAAARAGQRLKPGRLHIDFHPEQEVLHPATTYETYQADHPIISFNEPEVRRPKDRR